MPPRSWVIKPSHKGRAPKGEKEEKSAYKRAPNLISPFAGLRTHGLEDLHNISEKSTPRAEETYRVHRRH